MCVRERNNKKVSLIEERDLCDVCVCVLLLLLCTNLRGKKLYDSASEEKKFFLLPTDRVSWKSSEEEEEHINNEIIN